MLAQMIASYTLYEVQLIHTQLNCGVLVGIVIGQRASETTARQRGQGLHSTESEFAFLVPPLYMEYTTVLHDSANDRQKVYISVFHSGYCPLVDTNYS